VQVTTTVQGTDFFFALDLLRVRRGMSLDVRVLPAPAHDDPAGPVVPGVPVTAELCLHLLRRLVEDMPSPGWLVLDFDGMCLSVLHHHGQLKATTFFPGPSDARPAIGFTPPELGWLPGGDPEVDETDVERVSATDPRSLADFSITLALTATEMLAEKYLSVACLHPAQQCCHLASQERP